MTGRRKYDIGSGDSTTNVVKVTRLRAAWAVLRAWARTEPVRVRVYVALVPLGGLLVARGVITGSDVPFLQAALLAMLGLAGGESARARVTPVGKHRASDGPPAADDVEGAG